MILVKPRRCQRCQMAIVAMLKQRCRNVLDYLKAACEEGVRDLKAPSWVPTP
jgi:hypothetical protein